MSRNTQEITSFAKSAVRWLLTFIILSFVLGVAMILTIISLPFAGYVTKKRMESTLGKSEGNYLESKESMGYQIDFKGFDGSANVTGKIFCETDCEMEARMEVIEQFGWLYDFEIEGVKYEYNKN